MAQLARGPRWEKQGLGGGPSGERGERVGESRVEKENTKGRRRGEMREPKQFTKKMIFVTSYPKYDVAGRDI